jgi:methylated-DNA-[protein]-cysteine S-methyltransferase
LETAIINTPIGFALIKVDKNGLASISVTEEEFEISSEIPDLLKDAAQQLNAYFENSQTDFNLKLNPQETLFQKRVWNALQEIPFGETISYLKLSQKLGDEKAIRAVAAANGKNPLWVVVPCHPVIGADGSLTGYTGGLWRKKWLLEHENLPIQTSLF